MTEIKDFEEAKQLIDYLTRFEDLMAALALAFIDASSETLDSEINHTLRQVADFANVRRSYLFLFNAEAGVLHNLYIWGDREFRRNWGMGTAMDKLGWLLPQLQNGQPVNIKAQELDAETRQNFGLGDDDVMIAAPLVAHDGVVGFLGMDWSGREPQLYDGKLLAQTAAFITGALERQRGEHHQSSELKLMRALIDSVPDMLYAKDTEGRFLLNNYAYAQLVGEDSPDALRGKTDFNYFPETLAQQYRENERAVLGGQVLDTEETFVTGDGTKRWMHVTKVPYRDAQGSVIGLVGVSRDITERKAMEESVKAKERLLRVVIDNVPALVYVKDRSSRFLLGNSAIVQHMGMQSEQELLGKSDADFHPADLAEKFRADEMAIMTSGNALLNHEEASIDHNTHTEAWYSSNKLPLRDEKGKIVGIVGINYDITQRKQVEEEVRRKEQLLRIVIDNLPSHVYVKDMQSRFMLANKACVHHMGASSEAELVGKSDGDFHPADLAEKFRADELEMLRSGEALLSHEEESMDHSTGGPVWLQANKLPLRDENGRIVGMVGINHDITERKHAENALRQMTDELGRHVEERTAELKQAHEQYARLQEQIIDAQKQTIQELSTPVIPILEQVIVMPLVGTIDSMRARDITRAMLAAITQQRAKVVLLDITGVSIVDTEVANHLNKTMQAARLKGATTIVTGISDAVAETIVDLGIDWTAMDTLRDLRSGLRVALERMGYQWVRKN
ncbi:MAG: PAS domain-containing protein [Anaerolineae bacterium]